MSATASRARDEQQLRWLRQFAVDGLTTAQIADRSSVGKGSVSGTLDRIRRADVAESGECPAAVGGAYMRGNCRLDRDRAVFP